jgi:hypothetical protein
MRRNTMLGNQKTIFWMKTCWRYGTPVNKDNAVNVVDQTFELWS